MPDRCEVLPGDSVVARRGGGLLWVDAPGSPALVAALHACLGVPGPGADRVLAAVAGQVSSLAHGPASFALVLADTSGGSGTGVALWSGKGQPAVDGVPVSGSSVEGCTLASGFSLGQTLYVGPGQAAAADAAGRRLRPRRGHRARLRRAAAARPPRPRRRPRCPPATSLPSVVLHRGSDAGFGSARRVEPRAQRRSPSPVSRPRSGGPSRRPRRCCASTTAWSSPSTRTSCSAAVPTTTSWSPAATPGRCRSPTPRTCCRRRTPRSSAPAARSRWSTSGRSTARTSPGPRPPSGPSSSPASPHPLSDGDRLLLGWTVITFEQPQRLRTDSAASTASRELGRDSARFVRRQGAAQHPGAARRSGTGARPGPAPRWSSPGARRSRTRWTAPARSRRPTAARGAARVTGSGPACSCTR